MFQPYCGDFRSSYDPVLVQKLTASDGVVDDSFGVSVSISGDSMVVGALGDDLYTGAAYVFVYDGNIWTQVPS